MPRTRIYLLGGLLCAAALAAGIYVGYVARSGSPEPAGSAALLRTPFTTLSGTPATLSQWRGRRLVVNFWATWCAPCREEMPLLNQARAQYASNGVEFVGIAVDSAAPVQQFVTQLDIRYPILIGGAEALELVRRLGNPAGGLPFTVLVEPDGSVSRTKLGRIEERDLIEWLGPAPQAWQREIPLTSGKYLDNGRELRQTRAHAENQSSS
ncbi:MAG: TlpA family protein disulfide reductase [Burkholderiales bacterium]|nr:TlpA family protein disulfide reductase [Burkholderiales bacterium]PZN01113.1 MAG: hypothetical protein DIU74_10570 [Pseudomonadota bacterium]